MTKTLTALLGATALSLVLIAPVNAGDYTMTCSRGITILLSPPRGLHDEMLFNIGLEVVGSVCNTTSTVNYSIRELPSVPPMASKDEAVRVLLEAKGMFDKPKTATQR